MVRRSLSVLNDIRVASPCPAAWDQMSGNDRERHCSLCDQPVYDLSATTAAEAVELLNAKSVCVRLYRRRDGKVITRDCPEGRSLRLRRFARRMVLAVASWFGFAFIAGCSEDRRCTQGKIYIPPPNAQKAGDVVGDVVGK